jgi:hypothetical protein
MATPTSLPSTFVTGNVFTAAQANGLRGAFRILQVVQGSTTAQSFSTSTTFANTGLSASITPQSTSNKVLAIVAGVAFSSTSATDTAIRLTRDQPSAPTVLSTASTAYAASGGAVIGNYFICYLDSPASASAITYRTQLARNTGAGISYDEVNGSLTTLTLLEVSA